VACGDDGIASFDRIRYRRHDGGVFLYAFDLIELDGADLRRDPVAVRKATLASLLARAAPMDMAFAINLSTPLSPLRTGEGANRVCGPHLVHPLLNLPAKSNAHAGELNKVTSFIGAGRVKCVRARTHLALLLP
jgi:hypothetical protein